MSSLHTEKEESKGFTLVVLTLPHEILLAVYV